MFKGYVAHRMPNEYDMSKIKRNPDAWLKICESNTKKGAHDECVRQIRGWNEGRKNPSMYWIYVLEVSK